jgi:hypothetical protein
MTLCISYAECHENVENSFKNKPREVVSMEMCSKGVVQVSFHQNPWRRLPRCSSYSKVASRWHVVRLMSCSLRPLHDDTTCLYLLPNG